ncbi:uncharacterized protein LOC132722282 [Ruditapes philippinarum]|uniref:uncharacterized protein LOC132722282 n=1 Tax=Ruditapes philippinarum TaxID=129788 RepID=UPI00295BBA4C|nr:uncharacterized protein LOC132722282 [Ruditapes philippinarum]
MKVTALIYITVVMIITIGFVTSNSGTEGADVKSSCKPFGALIMWYTGSGEDSSFFQHRRLLVMLIRDFPDNTIVSIVTFGANDNMKMQFSKQAGSTSWRDRILNYKPGNSLNHVVSYADIRKALSYPKSNSSDAQLVYLLVNSNTVIRDEENSFEELRKKKTFVILSEIQTADTGQNWLKLASNDHHFFALDSKEVDVSITKQIILLKSCQDSMFVCDTDMYWSRERSRCDVCTNICLSAFKVQQEYCVRACPFFHQPEALQIYTETVVCYNSPWLIIGIIHGIELTVVVLSLVAYKKRRSLLKCKNSVCRWMANPQDNLPYHMKSTQRSETKDLYDKTDSKDERVKLLDEYNNPTDSNDFGEKSDMELKVFS